MAGINLQFHALPCELYEFSREEKNKHDLALVGVNFSLRESHIMTDKELMESQAEGASSGRTVVFVRKNSQLLLQKPLPLYFNECLELRIGKLSEKKLDVSLLKYMGDNGEDFAIWRRIAADLKKLGRVGGTFIAAIAGPSMGHLFPIKNHRISEKARALATQTDNKLLAFGGQTMTISDI